MTQLKCPHLGPGWSTAHPVDLWLVGSPAQQRGRGKQGGAGPGEHHHAHHPAGGPRLASTHPDLGTGGITIVPIHPTLELEKCPSKGSYPGEGPCWVCLA